MMAMESLTWAFPIVWYNIKEQEFKPQPIGYKHSFCSDLTKWLDPIWPISKLIGDIIETNIVTNFHENWTESVVSIAYLRFLSDLNWWPSFWPKMTHFQTRPKYQQGKHLIIYQEYCAENVASMVYTRFFYDLTLWPSFWLHMTYFWLVRDVIEANILTKFHEYRTENVVSRAYTR